MSDQDTWHREREVTLVISDVVVKGYHECLFSVDIGDKFVARKKRGDLAVLLAFVISPRNVHWKLKFTEASGCESRARKLF